LNDDQPNLTRIKHTHNWLWTLINSRAHYLIDQYGEYELYCLLCSWDTGDCSDAGLVGVLFKYLLELQTDEEQREYSIDTMKIIIKDLEKQ
jgi:hypothetical protein